MFTGTSLALSVLGLALITGCGGRSNSPRADHDAGGSLVGNGGNNAASNDDGAGADAGGVASTAGGTTGTAGRSASGGSVSNAAHAGSAGTVGNGAGMAGVDNSGGSAGASGSVGTAGSTGSTAAQVTAACKNLCTDWIRGSCSIWEFAPATCTSDCSSDLGVQNGGCTDLGLSMMSCITAGSGTSNDALCLTPFSVSVHSCRAQVEAFQACTAGGSTAPQPKICMRAGNVFSGGGCAENRFCTDSVSSELKCSNTPDGKSSCECWNYNTTTQAKSSTTFTFDGQSGDLCLDHMDECLASRGAL
ncbi:MAG TPA: hypothetical protein VER96_29225 [Polyangiaceae bacterium]|nr:hypothetical protein [Polyangiaceae bacterium]